MKYIFFLFIVIIFSNCNDDKSNIENNEITSNQIENIDSINKVYAENLRIKYSAINLNIDSSNYTYEFEHFIDSIKENLYIKGSIIDIIKNSNNDYSIIISTNHSKYFKIKSIIKADSSSLNKLKFQLKGRINKGYFIIKVYSISSLFPILVAVKDSDEDAELTYDLYEKVVKIKADLIDFYINKKYPKYN